MCGNGRSKDSSLHAPVFFGPAMSRQAFCGTVLFSGTIRASSRPSTSQPTNRLGRCPTNPTNIMICPFKEAHIIVAMVGPPAWLSSRYRFNIERCCFRLGDMGNFLKGTSFMCLIVCA